MAAKGRPSAYTKALADRICTRLADGESLNAICKDDKMPYKSQVYRWLLSSKLKDFQDNYARSREVQAYSMADEMLDIADNSINDWMTRTYGEEEIQVVNNEAINRSRLRIDTRKFLLSKLLPKKYGEKLEFEDAIPKDRERRKFVLVPMSDSE